VRAVGKDTQSQRDLAINTGAGKHDRPAELDLRMLIWVAPIAALTCTGACDAVSGIEPV
jgi:hypothetical protein